MEGLNIKNILIAEDDEDDFLILSNVITSICASISVQRASNGAHLLKSLEDSVYPDVIFLDINMPVINGISCLGSIKKSDKFRHLQVVMCSTSSNPREIDNCYKSGADFYLVKPSTYNQFLQQFKSLFTNEYFLKNERPPKEAFVL